VEVYLHQSLPRHEHPGRFTPEEKAPNTHWIRSWVSPRAGQDAVKKRKKCCLCHECNTTCPTRSPSLCRLNHPCSSALLITLLNKLKIISAEYYMSSLSAIFVTELLCLLLNIEIDFQMFLTCVKKYLHRSCSQVFISERIQVK
jgi:hypothetical protein